MAKEFTSRVATDCADEAVQAHGGRLRRRLRRRGLYRDAKITQIYEGTSEIQKNVVARELLRKGY
jgi:acyl-CoA dehydrogenase